MAIPATTRIWPETLDPSEILDFKIDCTALLETDENIANFNIEILPESLLMGLNIVETDGYATHLEGKTITVWLEIDSSEQENVAFQSGLVLPLELTLTTTSVPARKKQRTVAVRVIQK